MLKSILIDHNIHFCYTHNMKKLDFYLKWSATVVIVMATLTTAFDITHWNKMLFLLGCGLWTWVGILWKQPSLWMLNLFCSFVYIIGMISH